MAAGKGKVAPRKKSAGSPASEAGNVIETHEHSGEFREPQPPHPWFSTCSRRLLPVTQPLRANGGNKRTAKILKCGKNKIAEPVPVHGFGMGPTKAKAKS